MPRNGPKCCRVGRASVADRARKHRSATAPVWSWLAMIGQTAGDRGPSAYQVLCYVDSLPTPAIRAAVLRPTHPMILGQEPTTTRPTRTVPVDRSVMRRLDDHLRDFVGQEPDAPVFEAPGGGPLFRAFGRRVLRPAVERAGLGEISFHGLRHSFVAILVAAGCNVREVSEWAGHNSVAFTLTRCGGLLEDDTETAVGRLDTLLGMSHERSGVAGESAVGEC